MFAVIRKAISVLLAVAAIAILVLGTVSYWRSIPESALIVSSLCDEPHVQWTLLDGTVYAVYAAPFQANPPVDANKSCAGFSVKRVSVGPVLAQGVGFPFWVPPVLLFICPLAGLVRGPWRRRRRRRNGLCIACGYNLTGLEEPRCPECGLRFERCDGQECSKLLSKRTGSEARRRHHSRQISSAALFRRRSSISRPD